MQNPTIRQLFQKRDELLTELVAITDRYGEVLQNQGDETSEEARSISAELDQLIGKIQELDRAVESELTKE